MTEAAWRPNAAGRCTRPDQCRSSSSRGRGARSPRGAVLEHVRSPDPGFHEHAIDPLSSHILSECLSHTGPSADDRSCYRKSPRKYAVFCTRLGPSARVLTTVLTAAWGRSSVRRVRRRSDVITRPRRIGRLARNLQEQLSAASLIAEFRQRFTSRPLPYHFRGKARFC